MVIGLLEQDELCPWNLLRGTARAGKESASAAPVKDHAGTATA
jgi:hypothetical protein